MVASSDEKEVATTESVLAETRTGRQVIMMNFGNGDKVNDGGYLAVVWSASVSCGRYDSGRLQFALANNRYHSPGGSTEV